jgi:hypothetical protein
MALGFGPALHSKRDRPRLSAIGLDRVRQKNAGANQRNDGHYYLDHRTHPSAVPALVMPLHQRCSVELVSCRARVSNGVSVTWKQEP